MRAGLEMPTNEGEDKVGKDKSQASTGSRVLSRQTYQQTCQLSYLDQPC